LGADDYISIVIYDQQVDVLQSAVRVLNKEQIKRKIDGIVDRGNTNLMGGASEGYNQVERNYDSRYVNRVLLLSDGLANQGITSQPQIEKIVREKSRKNGISISTFGVGRDYNEDLMTAMAETGNGNYYFIDKPADISGIFRQELNFLQDVIAQRAELRVTIPEFVRIDQVYGQSYTLQGRTLIINLHDIFSDETRGVLVRYTVLPGYTVPVHFRTTLNYLESGYNQKRSIHMNNYSNYTSSEYTYRNSSNEWVATQIALYHSNERMEQALKEVDKGNYSEAKKIIQSNKEYLSAQPKSVQEAPAMQKVVTINENYDTQLDDVQSMNEDEIKYMQKDAKNSNYKVRAKKK
jgi:Ca-activated chloride channel family protein